MYKTIVKFMNGEVEVLIIGTLEEATSKAEVAAEWYGIMGGKVKVVRA